MLLGEEVLHHLLNGISVLAVKPSLGPASGHQPSNLLANALGTTASQISHASGRTTRLEDTGETDR